MTWQMWVVAVGVVGLGVVTGLVIGLRVGSKRRRQRHTRQPIGAPKAGPVVIVLNPTKSAAASFRLLASQVCQELGFGAPIWLETTAASPGTAQAAQAVKTYPGLRLVVAAGGDGTVRAVAAGLAGTPVPLGIVPLGTANLLARNLKLTLNSPRVALQEALSGHTRAIDIGRISTWDATGQCVLDNQAFLVIAGLGFDAELVGSAEPKLKARLGWPAYFISGINHLAAKPVKVQLAVGLSRRTVHARSVMFGNCGMLPARLNLVPDADLSDGLLDLAMVETRHGLVGWVALVFQLILNGLGIRWTPAWASGRIWYEQAPRFEAVCDAEYKVQLDGELTGLAKTIEVMVEPQAVRVCLPAATPPEA